MDYKEKVRLAKEALESGSYDKETIEYIFPELKESEDERLFEEIYKDLHTYYMIQKDKFVLADIKEIWDDKWSKAKAWLEKQGKNNMGISEATKKELEDNLNKALEKETSESWNKFLDEQIPADKVEPKFKVGQTIKKEGFNLGFTIVKIEDGFYYNDMGDNFPFTDQGNWELVEQNPALSEEDEKKKMSVFLGYDEYEIGNILSHLKACLNEYTYSRYEKYLKSLRPQTTWKPSDEQIKVLSDLIAYKERWESSHSLNILKELLDDLKKLKG